MSGARGCFDASKLQVLAAGKLPEAEAEAVLAHLKD